MPPLRAPQDMLTPTLDPATTLAARGGLRLRAFGWNELPAALDYLTRSYATTPVAYWQRGHQRLREVPPNPGHREPIGVYLESEGRVRGALLTLHSPRGDGQGRCNLSSWFIESSARLHSLWMGRQASADPAVAYTTLTPIAAVQRLLPRGGFQAVSEQAALVFTPKLARRARGAVRVLDGARTVGAVVDPVLRGALEDHRRLGCFVAGLETKNGLVPLVFRRRRRLKLLPVAELIYTPSTAAVIEHAGDLGRWLVGRGCGLMEFEAPGDLELPFPCTQLFRRRYGKGPYAAHGIDHLYSELVYLGVD